jgi:hypothetical protein
MYAAEVLRMDNGARDLIPDVTRIEQLPEHLGQKDPGTQTFKRAVENSTTRTWSAKN